MPLKSAKTSGPLAIEGMLGLEDEPKDVDEEHEGSS